MTIANEKAFFVGIWQCSSYWVFFSPLKHFVPFYTLFFYINHKAESLSQRMQWSGPGLGGVRWKPQVTTFKERSLSGFCKIWPGTCWTPRVSASLNFALYMPCSPHPSSGSGRDSHTFDRPRIIFFNLSHGYRKNAHGALKKNLETFVA